MDYRDLSNFDTLLSLIASRLYFKINQSYIKYLINHLEFIENFLII